MATVLFPLVEERLKFLFVMAVGPAVPFC
jgi:hypothetical protein